MTYHSIHPVPPTVRRRTGQGASRGISPVAPLTGGRYGGLDDWVGLRSHCPVCLGELAAVLQNETVAHRFRHASADDEARCPLTTSSYQPEGLTVRHLRNVVREGVQRGMFMGNWLRHFRLMRQLAPSLTVRRLTLLVEYADVLNLWSYPDIRQIDLPYVLLVLAGFIRHEGPQGEIFWVRFCFDDRVRDVGDLWNDGAVLTRLFRMVYCPPRQTPFPTSRELMHFQMIEWDRDFLERPEPRALRRDVRAFQRFLEEAGTLEAVPPETGAP